MNFVPDSIASYHYTLFLGLSGMARAYESAAKSRPEMAAELLKLAAAEWDQANRHWKLNCERIELVWPSRASATAQP